jgi:tetratricopeptide (TPR) repeat protein
LPVVFLLLLYKLLAEEKCPIAKLGRNLGLMFLVIIIVAGWFYMRNWLHFNKVFVSNWDCSLMSPQSRWWQDPGFHTYKYFCQFGKVFTAPYFAGTYSFFDSLYSTFWGDAFLGGKAVYMFRPLWNYEYISAVYLLAIPATLAIIIGAVCAISNVIRKANKIWLLMLGSVFVLVCSIVYINLQIAYYSAAKAFYGLGAILPISLIFSFGFDSLNNWLRDKKLSFLRVVLYGWFGTLILAILLSIFVRPNQVYVIPDLLVLAKQGKLDQVVTYYTQLVYDDPNNWDAHYELAKAYILQHNHNKAIEHYKKTLQLSYDGPNLLNNLALALINKPDATWADKTQAVQYAELSCQLTGYLQIQPVLTLASTYAGTEQSVKAIMTAEKAIKLAVSSGQADLAEKTQEWLQRYKMRQVPSKPSPIENDAKP